MVFYSWGEEGLQKKYDPDFKQHINWDLPLLNGYNHTALKNTAKHKGTHHFMGIQNPDVIGQIKSFNPDALLVYGWSFHSHLKAIRYFKGKLPVWFRGDSTLLDHHSGFKSFLRHLFLKWLYSHVDAAFYVGTQNKAYFKQAGLKEDQLIFAPHAIDNDRFENDGSNNENEFRKQLGLKESDILVLFAGKFEDKKNPLLLLNAFLEVSQPHIHLLFVGNGHLSETLKHVVAGSPSHHIHIADFQNQTQMPKVYQACDLFCLPSKGPHETWGLAINEAMAAGKAILVSDKVGSAVDLVVPGENGYIFESENQQDLTNKLHLLTTEKDTLFKMGIHSKQIIQNWSFQQQTEVILTQLNQHAGA